MTPAEIEALAPNAPTEVGDKGHLESVPGLYIRVKDGRKAWCFRYRSPETGKRRLKTLGPWPLVDLRAARRMAKTLYLKTREGVDPLQEQLRTIADNKTVTDAYHHAMTHHWPQKSLKWRKEVVNIWRSRIAPTLANTSLKSVTPKMIRDWHRAQKDTPFLANRAKSILSKCFSVGIEEEWLPLGANPCMAVKSFPEAPRDRYASVEELSALGAALKARFKAHPREVAFLYVLLLTGARPSSIERARWQDVEIVSHGEKGAFGVLTRQGKTGREQIILPPPALKILAALSNGPLDSRKGPLVGIKMPRAFWARLRQEAGLQGLWMRDCRRTFATLARSRGLSVGQIASLLNHKSQQTTERYAQVVPKDKIDAAITMGGFMGDALDAPHHGQGPKSVWTLANTSPKSAPL